MAGDSKWWVQSECGMFPARYVGCCISSRPRPGAHAQPGTRLDSVPAMHLVRASHANLTARLILYRLEQIRHAQEQRNAIPREKPQKTPNRQSFPTARKSHGTLIRRPLSVDTDTDRK